MKDLQEEESRKKLLKRYLEAGLNNRVVSFETGLSKECIRNFIEDKSVKTNNLKKIKKQIDDYVSDKRSLEQLDVDDLLIKPIRFLHLGPTIEQRLLAAGITHVHMLVTKTPYILSTMNIKIGISLSLKIEKSFGSKLKFGMEAPNKTLRTSWVTEVVGEIPEVSAAISSINRHIAANINHEEIGMRVVNSPSLVVRAGQRGSLNNHPFRLAAKIQCGENHLEIKQKKYRGCKELAKDLRRMADKIDGIGSREEWEKSEVWVSDL